MSEVFQIILLPSEGYWDWVGAVRDYVVRYGTPVTPRPENAADFHRPDQVVTIVNFPEGYPLQGDIVAWFQANAPNVKLDVVTVTSPDQLRGILDERVAKDWRFGTPEPEPGVEGEPVAGPGSRIELQWPTDYDVVTQPFGVNADYYSRWGLPGHEGVDIRAPRNTKIYACAEGVVYRAERDAGSGAYGKHVRVRHEGGFKTIYAHLNEVMVDEGQAVQAGEVVGLADSTGNSSGDHLHLSLKLEGATAAGQTNYPFDIIDPTPFLLSLEQSRGTPERPAVPWAYKGCLVGVHGRADGPLQEADWEPIRLGRVEALKLLSWANAEDVDRAREINPNMFILARLMFSFGDDGISPRQFVDTVAQDLEKLYGRGIRYIEVHNEPNLAIEGWGTSWRDGSEFAQFWLRSVELLKERFPEGKWGWPGCSPGPGISGQRFDMWSFIEGARDAIEAADWLGVHCYWQGPDDRAIFTPSTGLEYEAFRDRWPDKLIFITEFSNISRDVDKATKARQYVRYYEHLRKQASVGAAFSFVLSASKQFSHESWRREDGGMSSTIPAAVGARSF